MSLQAYFRLSSQSSRRCLIIVIMVSGVEITQKWRSRSLNQISCMISYCNSPFFHGKTKAAKKKGGGVMHLKTPHSIFLFEGVLYKASHWIHIFHKAT